MAAIPGGVGKALTRKIGPLPAWGWGVGIGGVLLAVKIMRGGSLGGARSPGAVTPETQTVLVPTGAPSIPHDYIGQLGTAVGEIRDTLGGIGGRLDELETMPGPTLATPAAAAPQIIYVQPTPAPAPAPAAPAPTYAPAPPPPAAAPTAPVSAKPTRITLAEAQAVLRGMGIRESLATSGAWINSAAAAYVWASRDAFASWARRATR